MHAAAPHEDQLGASRSGTSAGASDSAVIRASHTDPTEFGTIFERHHAAIESYLRRRVAASEAEELAAETFVLALEARGRFDDRAESARPWLFGIATNLLRRHWRRERRQLRAYARTGVDPTADEVEEAEDRIDAERSRKAMAAALAKLTRDQREVLLLHAWAELSDSEIAQAIGVPLGTVQSRLSRARRRIREANSSSGQLAEKD